jgi:hypothetical protein
MSNDALVTTTRDIERVEKEGRVQLGHRTSLNLRLRYLHKRGDDITELKERLWALPVYIKLPTGFHDLDLPDEESEEAP